MRKKLRKRMIATLGSLALVTQIMPSYTVFAYEDSMKATTFTFSNESILVDAGDYSGYKMDGTALTINDAGTYVVSGSCENGSIKVKKGTTGVTLVLAGISLTSSDTAPICCNKGSEVSIIADAGTVNTLADTALNNDDNNPENTNAENAVIKCKDGSKVSLSGTGTLNITANGKNGIKSGATTEAEGEASLLIEEVTLNIAATVKDAVNAEASLQVKSGNLDISAAGDALHSDYDLVIGEQGSGTEPAIHISSCDEGLEGANVAVYSGNLDIHATSDGINAANSDLTGHAFSLEIAGGEVHIDTTTGDGLDSNGTLLISGGKTEIFSTGETSDGNVPLDSDGTFQLTGGTVFAVGRSGMTQNPSSASQNYISFGSTQNGMMQNPNKRQGGLSIAAGDSLTITDSANAALYSATAVRVADYVFYSDSTLVTGGAYTLNVNGSAVATASAAADAGSSSNQPGGGQPSAPGESFTPGGQPSIPEGSFTPGEPPSAPTGSFTPGGRPSVSPTGSFMPGDTPAVQVTSTPVPTAEVTSTPVPTAEAVSTPAPNQAEEKVALHGGYYKVISAGQNRTVQVTGSKQSLKKVTIPSTVQIDGKQYKVTAIAANAFKNHKKLKKVTIGANVKSIGKNAFRSCKNLTNMVIKTKNLKTIGNNAFRGISSKAVIKVPKNKVKSYGKMIRAKGGSKKIKIVK